MLRVRRQPAHMDNLPLPFVDSVVYAALVAFCMDEEWTKSSNCVNSTPPMVRYLVEMPPVAFVRATIHIIDILDAVFRNAVDQILFQNRNPVKASNDFQLHNQLRLSRRAEEQFSLKHR